MFQLFRKTTERNKTDCVEGCREKIEFGIAADFSSNFGSFHFMIMVHPVGMPKSAMDGSFFFLKNA